jgi:hypothetical protein
VRPVDPVAPGDPVREAASQAAAASSLDPLGRRSEIR